MAVGRGRQAGKLLVDPHTVYVRVRRALKAKGQKLLKVRGADRYIVTSAGRNRVLAADHSLDALARELDVLAPYEAIAPEAE